MRLHSSTHKVMQIVIHRPVKKRLQLVDLSIIRNIISHVNRAAESISGGEIIQGTSELWNDFLHMRNPCFVPTIYAMKVDQQIFPICCFASDAEKPRLPALGTIMEYMLDDHRLPSNFEYHIKHPAPAFLDAQQALTLQNLLHSTNLDVISTSFGQISLSTSSSSRPKTQSKRGLSAIVATCVARDYITRKEICPITAEELVLPVAVPPCGHVASVDVINCKTCPMCRLEIADDEWFIVEKLN